MDGAEKMKRLPSAGFSRRLGYGKARYHHRIDNLIAALEVCHDNATLAPADEQKSTCSIGNSRPSAK
jgi:hypothetical protein